MKKLVPTLPAEFFANSALSAVSVFLLSVTAAFAQIPETITIDSFNKVIASPRVNVVLKQGETESLQILYNNIPKDAVNVRQKGNKLHIYLDHARTTEKQVNSESGKYGSKRGLYEGYSITAYITYKKLKGLEIRGEEEMVCEDPITSDKLKIRAYGASEIRLASVDVRKFKAVLYGENKLRVAKGNAWRQVFGVFGDNLVDTRGLVSDVTDARSYGEGVISITALDNVHITAMGEPRFNVWGQGSVTKGLVIGNADVFVRR